MTYRLIRTLPDGRERMQDGLPDLRAVSDAAYYVLRDNGLTTKEEAQEVSELVMRLIGKDVKVESCGYTFRAEEEH